MWQVRVNVPYSVSTLWVNTVCKSAAVNEKLICRPSTDTGLDPSFLQTLHFCPIDNLYPTKRVFPLPVQSGEGRGAACTFLTQLEGSFIPDLPLAPLTHSLPLAAFKEQTLLCHVR